MRNTLVHSFIKEDENFARFEFNITIGISEPRKYNSVEETKIGTDVWHTLPTNKIHSVENIDINKKRISLTVSIV